MNFFQQIPFCELLTKSLESLDNLRTQKLAITVPFQTWQAKSLLAKAKLLPQIAYVART